MVKRIESEKDEYVGLQSDGRFQSSWSKPGGDENISFHTDGRRHPGVFDGTKRTSPDSPVPKRADELSRLEGEN